MYFPFWRSSLIHIFHFATHVNRLNLTLAHSEAKPTGDKMPPELPDHSLTVLVIGNGGREHALAWKLSHDKSVRQVFVFPGNPGTQNIEAKDNAVAVSNITQKISDYRELAQFAKELDVGLAVVGCPVSNTANGIEEYFREGKPVIEPR
jgi:hypothetical protein